MRTIITWHDKIPDKDGKKSCVNDVAFNPDGTQIVVGVGNRVLVYDTADGTLCHTLKGHKDTVYSVDFSCDGKRFASGGADKTVVIWTSKAEGILKYTHNDSVQKLKYNPVTQQLCSCAVSDFGLWSPEQKSVQKYKCPAKILCAAWTNDGQHIALGMYNGLISIRDNTGLEKSLIERVAPVWTLSWSQPKNEAMSTLAVGSWDGTLSFYQINGTQQGKDRKLGYDPTSVEYFCNSEYLVIGGSNKQVFLYSKEGVKLGMISTHDDWVWASKGSSRNNMVCVGCNDGVLAMQQVVFATVHALYQDRYAYRENMTDVIVQHLITEQKVRIKCRDHVKKLAIYKDRLAVQLSDKIIVYEHSKANTYDMHYKVKDKIHQNISCNLLVVTSRHLTLCHDKRLQLYTFHGQKERVWILDAVIRYIKVVGGAIGREGLVVGLKNGAIYKIFLDNPFPILLVRIQSPIRCIDMSPSRNKLAVVDEKAELYVYDLDMVCYSGDDVLNIKTGNFPASQQKQTGFVVGFTGSKIFCLDQQNMESIEVSQSMSLYRYIEAKDWDSAYHTACLGVTENDWRYLAMEAMKAFKLEVAKKAFIRVKDMKYIQLLTTVEQTKKNDGTVDSLFQAEILATQGLYQDAAKAFVKAGAVEKAITMFTDLRRWDEAKAFATSSSSIDAKDLVRRQAVWAEAVGDFRAAADMYLASGDTMKAVKIYADRGWHEELMELARTIKSSETELLSFCGHVFNRAKKYSFAVEVYRKLGDVGQLMGVHVALEQWEDAAKLAMEHPELPESKEVLMKYGDWLAMQDLFDDAFSAYNLTGRQDLSLGLLRHLTANALTEKRFADAAYYYYLQTQNAVKLIEAAVKPDLGKRINMEAVDPALLKKYKETVVYGDIYYAYAFIYASLYEPFTSVHQEVLFQAARFILNRIGKDEMPPGVSKRDVLYCLAKQCVPMGAFKLARYCYEKLLGYRMPSQWLDHVEVSFMMIQAKPFSDKDELLPVCYRSSTINPLVNTAGTGDVCITCGHPFVRSFASMEILPLVEFALEDGISDEEAERLIITPPPSGKSSLNADAETRHEGGAQSIAFGNDHDDDGETDLFQRVLNNVETGKKYAAVKLDSKILLSLKRDEVFIVKSSCSAAVSTKYFKNMIPEIRIALCPGCQRFFHEDDFEFAVMEKGHCPYCWTDPYAEGTSSLSLLNGDAETFSTKRARGKGGEEDSQKDNFSEAGSLGRNGSSASVSVP